MKVFLLFIFLSAVFIPIPAHAYAGPGVAIGALIVFFTILFTFFASIFISIFSFFKNNLKKIIRKNSKVKNKKLIEK